MEVVSVNLGEARPLGGRESSGKLSGIDKRPSRDAVRVTRLGLEGDAICDEEHHGGPDQAVYVYGMPDYDWWSGELGRHLEPGLFGENLTITEFCSAQARIGDQFQIGELALQVTAPRIPCGALEAHMGLKGFAKRFREAERPGVYCRVVREGVVRPGDAIRYQPYRSETVSVVDVLRDAFDPVLTEAEIQRFLKTPLAIRARRWKEKQLARLLEERTEEPG